MCLLISSYIVRENENGGAEVFKKALFGSQLRLKVMVIVCSIFSEKNLSNSACEY